jgi:PAS domain S-box-containing protein
LKIAALLAMSSVIPLVVASYFDIRQARSQLHDQGTALLAARADQLADKLDTFNRGYQLSVVKLAALPAMAALVESADDARRSTIAHRVLGAHTANDKNLRGAGLLDPTGRVIAATESELIATTIDRPYLHDAVAGATTISELHAVDEAGGVPTIAYAAPVQAGGRVVGVAVLWVRAASLWDVARTSNGLAGDRSFAVVFDRDGIRIAHTYDDRIVFHPGGTLEPETIARLVSQRRFGAQTRQLLESPQPFPEQFDRARAAAPDPGLFEGFAPVNQTWNYGVARRLATVPWTAFYMIPASSLDAPVAVLTRDRVMFAAGIVFAALLIGAGFASSIVRRVRSLADATAQLTAGVLSARAEAVSGDELGRLGESFNKMAARIESQDSALRRHRDDLEHRVTERTADLVEAKTAIERSEQDLATTLDSIGDAVIATDADGRIVRMNPVAQQLTGWALAEARGRPLREVFHIVNESTRLEIQSPAEIVLQHGVTIGLANHTALVSRDGTERAIADSGAPIRDSTGAIRGVVLVFRDQTLEREAERRLRASEARTTAVMESALDAIIVMDSHGLIVDLNPAALELFGYSREDAVGRSLAETMVPPALRDAHVRGLRGYRETQASKILGKRLELSAIRRDGSEFPAEIAVVRIGSDGEPLFTGYIRDITERKRAAEAETLQRAKEAAEAANVELEAFSYSVAHDLRAPLRAINGFSQLILEDYAEKVDAEGRDYLQRIATASHRMGQLIDGLLALAKIAKPDLERERVDLSGLARSIAAHFDSPRDVVWNLADPLIADGDPRLLRSLMENLLGNAWKFTRDRKPATIEVGTVNRDAATVFYVKDNGVGFDMAHARQLFSPFRRLHTDADFEGTGIGLATVERIVRRHGGRIWAESAPGEGATFYFTLPVTSATRTRHV